MFTQSPPRRRQPHALNDTSEALNALTSFINTRQGQDTYGVLVGVNGAGKTPFYQSLTNQLLLTNECRDVFAGCSLGFRFNPEASMIGVMLTSEPPVFRRALCFDLRDKFAARVLVVRAVERYGSSPSDLGKDADFRVNFERGKMPRFFLRK